MISETTLLELGGKLWEKGNLKRIYLNSDTCKKLIESNGYEFGFTDFELEKLKKAKTFFDINSGELKSDIGTVRVLLNRHVMRCTK